MKIVTTREKGELFATKKIVHEYENAGYGEITFTQIVPPFNSGFDPEKTDKMIKQHKKEDPLRQFRDNTMEKKQ